LVLAFPAGHYEAVNSAAAHRNAAAADWPFAAGMNWRKSKVFVDYRAALANTRQQP
jgi:hypothetical protein